MIVLAVDEEAYREAWEDYMEDMRAEAFIEGSQEFYEDLLRTNLEQTSTLADIPEDLREDLAEMGAKVYADQIERVMNSSYVGDEYELAAASALLQPKRQIKVGAQAQGIVDLNWDEIKDETEHSKVQYQDWIAKTLINPWPPSDFEIERVDRFKPPSEDRTFQ